MEAKRFIILQTLAAVQSGSITAEEGVDEVMTLLDGITKPLEKEVRELTDKILLEIHNGSRSREQLADLKLSIEPTQTIINGFANLFDGYVKDKELQQKFEDQKMTAFNLNEIRKDNEKEIKELKKSLQEKYNS